LNRLNAALASGIRIRPGARILDAGCGIGGSAIWLARTFGAFVTGITPVESQVERARRIAGELGVADRVQFMEQDYTCTTFPDASFDVVWAMESVCHAADKGPSIGKPGVCCGLVAALASSNTSAAHGSFPMVAKPCCTAGCPDGQSQTLPRLRSTAGGLRLALPMFS